ncbi:MAG: hypothetical protein K1X75_10770 [Leptospirales bacterium]|nr:hypothetical protein [Leptospirales bacterium]
MRSALRSLLFLAAAFLGLLRSPIAETQRPLDDARIQHGLVLLRITPAYYNQAAPWIREAADSYSALGLVASGERILALADQLQDASLIELQQVGSYRRSLAHIELSDSEANLAILRAEDPQFFQGLRPLPLGDGMRPGLDLTAVKIDTMFRVYRENNRVKELNAQTQSGVTVLPMAAFRTTDPFFSGITICGPTVCGLIRSADRERRTEAIPGPVIQAFLERSRELRSYAGFASQGFVLSELTDPALRELLKAGASGGALVARVVPGSSAAGQMLPGDVVLSIDGKRIDELGYYEQAGLGRQLAPLALALDGRGALRKPGDSVALVILRNGERRTLRLQLRRYTGEGERIRSRSEDAPSYLIENGLVFVEFTVSAAHSIFGAEWPTRAAELGFLYRTRRFYESGAAADRIILVSAVLPDEASRSYDRLAGAILRSVNGQPAADLRQLKKKLDEMEAAGTDTAVAEFSGERIIYLDLKNRRTIGQRILARYSIPAADNLSESAQRR